MPRALHAAILRNAARLVPTPVRTEWLAEWSAELWYVEHDATSFCLGSFRDALWLRLRSLSARRVLSLDPPLRCVLFLLCLVVLVLSPVAVPPPSSPSSSPTLSADGAKVFAVGLAWMYLESLLVLLTLDPLGLGDYSANGSSVSLLIRFRRWAFLAIKVALLPPILFLAMFALAPIFPAIPALILPGLILGFRWALADQRQRCPVCLHSLSNPVELGRPGHILSEPHGTEAICLRGHGSLYVLSFSASWSKTQRWHYAFGLFHGGTTAITASASAMERRVHHGY